MSEFNFEINKKLGGQLGRAGKITTPNGVIETPAFVTVGTKADVKGVTVEQLRAIGSQVVLANTYHLYLQPGDKLIGQAGGFGPFMKWDGPTMTDSGGFQVFSLGEAFGTNVSKVANGEADVVSQRRGYAKTNKMATIDEDGVTFKSYLNGDKHRFTPESSMEIQWNLGADMIFAFDECTSPHAPLEYQKQAMDRTHRWAMRSLEQHWKLDPDNKQALFGVVQGGRFEDLRRESARTLADMKTDNGDMFDGFGIGGSFNKDDMASAVAWVNQELPENKPRHMLGIGDPLDIISGIENGCDLFDCVEPTRIARHGNVYTKNGKLNLFNAKFREDFEAIDTDCACPTCSAGHTRAYLSHLLRAKEQLAGTLASIHNLYFITSLTDRLRQGIHDGNFNEIKADFLKNYKA
ncbi:MAG: tRNA guanosine(34) transglycosylase Tgt [Candidatus Nomurabacteria bacterium]|nr:tRNA guanosine(34) transglycosylase Tgt [Candidatus Nomurabacteria bacterium]